MNDYNNEFNSALIWVNNHKMNDNPTGAIALAGYMILLLLKELNLKIEEKPQNYDEVKNICEKYLTKYEKSTNQMAILTTIFLNVGLDALHEMHKKINNKKNQSEDLIKKINIWINEDQNKDYHKSFKFVTNSLTSFNNKINVFLEMKNPVNIKENLLKKYRSSL